jgi:hypothetical protein
MIRQAQVFGLRCSGTNYLEALAAENFCDTEVLRSNVMAEGAGFGWKHSDIGSILPETIGGQRFGARPLTPEVAEETLLMVCYRSPFDWLRSLHKKPHHAPEFVGLDLKTFLTRPWRAYLSELGQRIIEDPDRMRWIHPDGLIESFGSVLHKRRERIAQWEGWRSVFPNVAYVNYESLKANPEQHLQEIAATYDIQTRETFQPAETYKGKGLEGFSGSRYQPLPSDVTQFLLDTVDWKIENGIGYGVKQNAAVLPGAEIEPNTLLEFTPSNRYYLDGALGCTALRQVC